MHRAVTAAYLGASGLTANGTVAAVSAIGAVGGEGAQVGDLISAGGSFSAAAALVYIVKQMVDGRLVSRDAGRVEAQQAEQIREAHELTAAAHERERKLEELYRAAITREKP